MRNPQVSGFDKQLWGAAIYLYLHSEFLCDCPHKDALLGRCYRSFCYDLCHYLSGSEILLKSSAVLKEAPRDKSQAGHELRE
jgi:hypothetical protein